MLPDILSSDSLPPLDNEEDLLYNSNVGEFLSDLVSSQLDPYHYDPYRD